MAPIPPVSVVIPNRDGAHLLRDTLPPLLDELPLGPHEILVVDDASTDDSVALLARDFAGVRVIALEGNVGFGAACNRGLQEAQHDLVLLLNSDMEVTPGSVALLAEHFAAPDVFAAGPEYRSTRPDAPPLPTGPGPVYNQVGAPAGGGLFRREAYLSLGGFDPLYHPFYWEDLDLGWNAWRAGYRILYDTRSHFVHRESATIKRLYSAAYVARVRARNRALFGWKNLVDPSLLRRHGLVLARRAAADLLRRGDAAGLLGLLDAWRMRRQARAARPSAPPVRSDSEILAQFHVELEFILGI